MIKLFNKWDTTGIQIADPGLKNYINLKQVIVPRSAGQHAKNRFWRTKSHIVERLISKLQVAGHRAKKHKVTSGRTTGKYETIYKIVLKTLEIIEEKTKQNPVAVLVKAIENAAPREEITTIEYGGARYPQAVDCSPLRRIDFVLRMMAQGSYQKSFKSKKSISQCLADEIMKAYTMDNTSNSIAKKLEVERQADSSR